MKKWIQTSFFFLLIAIACTTFASNKHKRQAKKNSKLAQQLLAPASSSASASAATSSASAASVVASNAVPASWPDAAQTQELLTYDPMVRRILANKVDTEKKLQAAVDQALAERQISGLNKTLISSIGGALKKLISQNTATFDSSVPLKLSIDHTPIEKVVLRKIELTAQQVAERNYLAYALANAFDLLESFIKQGNEENKLRLTCAQFNFGGAAIRLITFYHNLGFNIEEIADHLKKLPKIECEVGGKKRAISLGAIFIKMYSDQKKRIALSDSFNEFLGDYINDENDFNDPSLRLIDAIRSKDIKRVGELATPEVMNKIGPRYSTALHYAALHNCFEITELLMARGANVYIFNNFEIPFLAAHKEMIDGSQDSRVVDLMHKETDINGILINYVFNGHINSEAVNETLIHIVFDELKRLGADFTCSFGDRGMSPLAFALISQNGACVGPLIAFGVDVTQRDSQGNTPLMIAVKQGDLARLKGLCQVLQQRKLMKAQLNAFNVQGQTPLTLADLMVTNDSDGLCKECQSADCVHKQIQKYMVSLTQQTEGYDINAFNSIGHTALMSAASQGLRINSILLLNRGANPRLTNPRDETALSLAKAGVLKLNQMDVANAADSIRRLGEYASIIQAMKEVDALAQKTSAGDAKQAKEKEKAVAQQKNAKEDVGQSKIKLMALINAVSEYNEMCAPKQKLTMADLAQEEFALDNVRRSLDSYFRFYRERNVSTESAIIQMNESHRATMVNPDLCSLRRVLLKVIDIVHEYSSMTPERIIEDQLAQAPLKPKNDQEKTIERFTDAVRSGEEKLVRTLLPQVPVSCRDEYGCPIILYPVINNHYEMVALLLSRGFEVNDQDRRGRVALMLARDQKMKTILNTKSKSKPTVHCVDERGNTPYLSAASTGSEYTLKALQEFDQRVMEARANDRKNALFLAIETGTSVVIPWLIAHECFALKEHDAQGRQPLIYALLVAKKYGCQRDQNSKCLHQMVCTQLAVSGALTCINEKGSDSLTSLMVACREGQSEVVEAILQKGGDFKITASNKRAWHFAQAGLQKNKKSQIKSEEYRKIIKLLQDRGGEKYEKDQLEAEEKAQAEALNRELERIKQAKLNAEAQEAQKRAQSTANADKKKQIKTAKKKEKKAAKAQEKADEKLRLEKLAADKADQLDKLLDEPISDEHAHRIQQFKLSQKKQVVNHLQNLTANAHNQTALSQRADTFRNTKDKKRAIEQLRLNVVRAKETRDSAQATAWYANRAIKKDALLTWRTAFNMRRQAKVQSATDEMNKWGVSQVQLLRKMHERIVQNSYMSPLIHEPNTDDLRWLDGHLNAHIYDCAYNYLYNKAYFKTNCAKPRVSCTVCEPFIDKDLLAKGIDGLHSIGFSKSSQFAQVQLKTKTDALANMRLNAPWKTYEKQITDQEDAYKKAEKLKREQVQLLAKKKALRANASAFQPEPTPAAH